MSKMRYTSHHVVPRSRGRGGREVFLPADFHNIWHCIFDNLYGEEIVVFIKRINLLLETEGTIDTRTINELREEIMSHEIHRRDSK